MQRRDFFKRVGGLAGLAGLAVIGALPRTKEAQGTLWATAQFKPGQVVENGSVLSAHIPEQWAKESLAILEEQMVPSEFVLLTQEHLDPAVKSMSEAVDRAILGRIKMQYDAEAQGTRVTVDLIHKVEILEGEVLACL